MELTTDTQIDGRLRLVRIELDKLAKELKIKTKEINTRIFKTPSEKQLLLKSLDQFKQKHTIKINKLKEERKKLIVQKERVSALNRIKNLKYNSVVQPIPITKTTTITSTSSTPSSTIYPTEDSIDHTHRRRATVQPAVVPPLNSNVIAASTPTVSKPAVLPPKEVVKPKPVTVKPKQISKPAVSKAAAAAATVPPKPAPSKKEKKRAEKRAKKAAEKAKQIVKPTVKPLPVISKPAAATPPKTVAKPQLVIVKPAPKTVAKPQPVIVKPTASKTSPVVKPKDKFIPKKIVPIQQILVSCFDKDYEGVVHIFLACVPSKLPFLTHPLKMSDKQLRDKQEYVNDMLPLMFEELKSQILSELEEDGVEVAYNGELLFNHKSLGSTSRYSKIGAIQDDDNAVAFSFTNSVNDPTNQLYPSDLVLFTLDQRGGVPPLRIYGYIIVGNKPAQATKYQVCSARILDDPTYPHTVEFVNALYDAKKNKDNIEYNVISNFITFNREYTAIQQFTNRPLSQMVLSPSRTLYDSYLVERHTIPTDVQSNMLDLNPSQIIAINQCMAKKGLTLIQGPPGTGKTKTIISLLSIYNAILLRNQCIMVCAPSNTAVDEVAMRLIKNGLVGAKAGDKERPVLIRLGKLEKVNPEVHSICIDRLPFGATRERERWLRSSRIILCTNSGAGSLVLKRLNILPSVVIIDESTQSTEPSTLIPLSRLDKGGKMVLIGDPKQLPPTCFSDISKRFMYDRSLFERLTLYVPVFMLDTQYRMQPRISYFPSKQFYAGGVKDGENVKSPNYFKTFHDNPMYGSINFYDITDSVEDNSSRSVKNLLEIKLVFVLIKKLVQDYPYVRDMSVGVITPYKLQKRELQEAKKSFNEKMEIDINTVDGFQGGERDIIIFSCVRQERIGFLRDIRRINVGITRARYGLFVVGFRHLLLKDPNWGAYIRYIKEKNGLLEITSKGIQVLEEQVREYDMAHPEYLVKTTVEELDELEMFNDDHDDHIHVEIEDIDSDDDEDDHTLAIARLLPPPPQPSAITSLLDSFSRLFVSTTTIDTNSTIVPAKDRLPISLYDSLLRVHDLQRTNHTIVVRKEMGVLRSSIKEKVAKIPKYNECNQSSQMQPTFISEFTKYLSLVYENIIEKDNSTKVKSFNNLHSLVTQAIPGCKLQLYGSFVSGIQLKSSDLDVCFISTEKYDMSTQQGQQLMRKVAIIIKRGGYKLEKIVRYSRVPIIKFVDETNNINYDMCFNNELAIGNSLLIQSYSSYDLRAKQLMTLIKYWSGKKGINDASQGSLSSYAYCNLVINYLQCGVSPPLLPNLQDHSSLHRIKGPQWSFHDPPITTSSNKQSLGELFYGFFKYYTLFDFDNNMVSIRSGKTVQVRLSARVYLDHHHKDQICIEDPFDVKHNPSASVMKRSFNVIKYELAHVESLLSSLTSITFSNISNIFSNINLMEFIINNNSLGKIKK